MLFKDIWTDCHQFRHNMTLSWVQKNELQGLTVRFYGLCPTRATGDARQAANLDTNKFWMCVCVCVTYYF